MKHLMDKLTTIENLEVFPMKFKEFEEKFDAYCEENLTERYGITFEKMREFIPSKHLTIVLCIIEGYFEVRFQAIALLEDGYAVIHANEGKYEPLFTGDMHYHEKTDKNFKEKIKQQSKIFKTIFEQYQQL